MAATQIDTTLYTRGGMDDRRGESMVQKHTEKIQLEKEQKAMEKLGALMPQLGRLAHAVALQECSWDVERALILLRQFHAENADILSSIQKKRQKLLREASGKKDKGGKGGADAHGSDASTSGSDSDAPEDEDSEGSGDKKRSRKSKSSKSKKSKGSKSKKSKKRKKERRDPGSPSANKRAKLTHGDQFGKYGILRETDYYSKRSEFILWAMDEKRIDVEIMPKMEEREMFKEYMEDYNTGTLPHKKYYDLDAYDKYKAAKAAKKGRAAEETRKKKSGGMQFNDEAELAKQRAEARAKAQADRLKEAFQELQSTSKAQDMREQELLRMQANLAYKTGDMATAQRLMERLKPDDQKKAEEEARKNVS